MAFDTATILRAPANLTIVAAATPRLQSNAEAAVEMAGGLLPLHKNAQLVCLVPVGDADASLDVALEISLDGGTTYREIACCQIPMGFKGQFAVEVGRAFRPYRYAAADVQLRAKEYNLTNAQWGAASLGVYLTTDETDVSGKKPDDTLMV